MRNKGELTERDRDELGVGELPEDLLHERGEFPFQHPGEDQIPPDMAGNVRARDNLARTGIGGPLSDYNVRGVYDSRPINGVDFNTAAYLYVAENVRDSHDIFQVPAGHVAVLREVTFFDPDDGFPAVAWQVSLGATVLAASLFSADIGIQFLKNKGVISPINMNPVNPSNPANDFYFDWLPVSLPNSIETFLVFDEGEVMGLNVRPTFNGAFNVIAYGQLLLKTGVPAPFEVGNKGAGKPVKALATSEDLIGMHSPRTAAPASSAGPLSPMKRRKRGFGGPMR